MESPKHEIIEFGSDFHWIDGFVSSSTKIVAKYDCLLLADGRQAIELLIKDNQWNRIWIPDYFCYDVVDSIRKAGIEVLFYEDYPGNDDSKSVSNINFKKNDVLLRMNYFGLRGWRDNTHVEIPVIEDHSHSPFGSWAKNSNADWCIASLRKTLPIAEGGILWSPLSHSMPTPPDLNKENEELAEMRWEAMCKKTDYLRGKIKNKDEFRGKFLSTESGFDTLGLSLIDKKSKSVLYNFDFLSWFGRKQENWQVLSTIKSEKVMVLNSVNNENFSFTLLCDSHETRNRLRASLIKNNVYPAILWQIPNTVSSSARDFSERMLSIHCDARYSLEDINQLKTIIEKAIKND